MNPQNQHPLQLALEELKTMPTIDIEGKAYTTVANRIAIFRRYFSDYSIVSDVLQNDDIKVVVQTKITTPSGVVIATGLAEEFRGKNIINTTSALENAETSSIGRALACLSLGGSEYASANEVQNAISQQEQVRQNTNQITTNQQNYQPQRQNTYQGQSNNNYDALINAGFQIVENNGYFCVYGDKVFESKELIKKYGFSWSTKDRLWMKQINYQKVG